MPAEELGVVFGVADSSIARLRNELGQFTKMDVENRAILAIRMDEIVRRVKDAIIQEFGPHDRSGRTIETLQVHMTGLGAEITIGGGAVYVEYGFAPHVIEGHPLHFMEGDQDIFTERVMSPGYAGDDFLGRAISKSELQRELDRIAYSTIIDTFGRAENIKGEAYTAGQQMFR